MSRELLFFLLGLLLTIPLSIAGNILTRKYDDVRAKRSFVVREKKLKTLIKDYSFIKSLKDDQSYAIFTVFRWVISSLFYLALLVGLVWSSILVLLIASLSRGKTDLIVAIVALAITVLWFVVLMRRTNIYVDYLAKFSYFSGYQRKVFEQIQKLGGNPEDLDKEEEIVETPQKDQHRR